jgi:hypothetical protein
MQRLCAARHSVMPLTVHGVPVERSVSGSSYGAPSAPRCSVFRWVGSLTRMARV